MSKGSWHRPVDRDKFNKRWDEIFKKKEEIPDGKVIQFNTGASGFGETIKESFYSGGDGAPDGVSCKLTCSSQEFTENGWVHQSSTTF